MKECLICGEKTNNNWMATAYHFRLIDFDQFQFFRGTLRLGLRPALTLISPLLNTILNWRHRKDQLNLPDNISEDSK